MQCGEASALARMALAAMDSEPVRNPVLTYADSYRDMTKQGVESVPIWSVITDLERNIARSIVMRSKRQQTSRCINTGAIQLSKIAREIRKSFGSGRTAKRTL